MGHLRLITLFLGCGIAFAAPAENFEQSIRPVLVQNCSACHNPANPKNRINFLKATTAKDIDANRGLWVDVSRNCAIARCLGGLQAYRGRPFARGRVDRYAAAGDRLFRWRFAGVATVRRLNRREYHNTIRDLLGVDFNVSDVFPADGTGGAGFDTNGETLFVHRC